MLEHEISLEEELLSAIHEGVDAVRGVLMKEGARVSKKTLFSAKDFPAILRVLVAHDATHTLSLFFTGYEQRTIDSLGFQSTVKYLNMYQAVTLGLRDNKEPEATKLQESIEKIELRI